MAKKPVKDAQDFDELFGDKVEVLDQEMVPANHSVVASVPGTISRTGLELPEDLPIEEWKEIGLTLCEVSQSVMWWIGDWIRYGEGAYGEVYNQALEETGYEYKTLRNAVYVASRIKLSYRKDNLSWSHHAAVAPLVPREQKVWLNRAEKKGWSRRQLQEEIKKAKENKSDSEQDQDAAKHPLIQRINQFKGHLASMKEGEIGQLKKAEAQVFLSTIAECRKDIEELEEAIAGKFGL